MAAAAAALVALTRTSASAAGFSAFAPRLQLAKAGKLTFSALSLKEQKALFEEFKATHGKRYGQTATASANDEESDRFAAFVDNLARADKRNARERQRGGTAVHGVTQFSDMTPGEFKRNYLGYVAPAKNAIKDADVAKVRKYTGSATSVNWTGVYTTAVNNQGYCGSCWAFSAVEQLESDAIRQGLLTKNEKLQLSVQQVRMRRQ
jgi:cathepsin F